MDKEPIDLQPEKKISKEKDGKDSKNKKNKKWEKKKKAKLKQKNEQRNHLQELQSNWEDALILVQNLPIDATTDEIAEFCGKCGVVRKNPQTKQYFIYLDKTSLALPQAIVSYFRPESVKLALDILDGAAFREGWSVNVSNYAAAQLTEEQRKALQPPNLKGLSTKVKLYDQSSELSWDEEEHRVLILKNMFSLDEVDWSDAPTFFKDLEKEIWMECMKYGEIEIVKVFESNPSGVVAIKFKDSNGAQSCLGAVDGRWFGGKKIEASYYDGWTDYGSKELEELTEKRVEAFGEWLGQEGAEQ